MSGCVYWFGGLWDEYLEILSASFDGLMKPLLLRLDFAAFYCFSWDGPGWDVWMVQDFCADLLTFLSHFPGGSDGKVSVYNVRDLGSIPGLGRFLGEGNGNPLQYSCLENPTDGGTWYRLLSMGSQRVGHDWVTSLTHSGASAFLFFRV